jgi:hypothetical protein
MTPEGKIKKRIKDVLKKVGAYYVMPYGAGYGNAGAPDFIVCVQGRFIGIEAKAGSNKATALQLHNLMEIRKAGGKSFVVNEDNIDTLEKELSNV